MKNILKQIISDKLDWIKYKKKTMPLSSFQHNITQSNRNFYEALKKNHPAFIFEFKKKSPSLGELNNFHPEFVANIYKKYASAISVLTDEKYFNGKFEFIPIIKNIAIHQPILCKDFFIDPYQIYLARYYQADAILLILSILTDFQYNFLRNLAISLKMNVLTEIKNQEELNRAIDLNAYIIGINNRNLSDFSISITNTCKLASKIPKNIISISESGITNYHQIRKLQSIVHGFLIGSSLMKSSNLENTIRKIIIGRNKICGLTNLKDLKISKKYGAIYAGFIFCKSSPRYIDPDVATNISHFVHIKYIGVFCDENIEVIINIIKKIQFYAIQLHGNENQKYINSLKKKISPSIKIWKAIPWTKIHVDKKFSFKNINKYVCDNVKSIQTTPFNWSLLKNKNLKDIFLAGGLNIYNCILASQIGCFGLDFNSGLEISPGIKDKSKIKLLFRSLRQHTIIPQTKF
ncbi:MAG: bifunctional indole-3-glycerol-phosphate synthase TrpC/phosphoribosylanthranilate isomerase TrpF [Buchnera aphidicola (Nurudea yanoniella)]